MTFIDVWNVQTFDSEIVTHLEKNADLICSYFETENQIFLEHDRNRSPQRSMIRPNNRYAGDYNKLLDMLEPLMNARAIRAFHYTRLTEDEVVNLRANGIHVSTPETLRQRLDAVVASGKLGSGPIKSLFQPMQL